MLIMMLIPSVSLSQSQRGLHEAASEGDAALVSRLIKDGADVNARNREGITPLMVAAGRGNVNIIAILLNNGADVNAGLDAEGYKGLTALMVAVFDGHEEAVRVLIEKGADVNAKYEGRWSALTIATAADRHAIANLLVKNGADATDIDKNVAQFKKTKTGMESHRAHIAALHATLKNAFLAAQVYLTEHPEGTVTKLSQLEEAGFSNRMDDVVFVRANISMSSGNIVFSCKRLDASNSIAAEGLRTGEGMINAAGDLTLPKIK